MENTQDAQIKDANFDLYLTNLQNFVFEDEKIVTYKWLSHELSVHVTLSKELLTQFVADHKDATVDPISVTYLLHGAVAEGFQFRVVRDTDLIEARKQFNNVISEQVFSVQRQTKLLDLNVLYVVDKGLGKNCIGKIGFDEDITRKDIKPARVAVKKDVPSDTKPKIVEKKGGISNMFQNQTKKQVEKQNTEVEPKIEKQPPKKASPESKSKPAKPAAKGGIASMFSKQAQLATKKPSIEKKQPEISTPAPKDKPVKKEQTPPPAKYDYRDILDTDDEEEEAVKMDVEDKTEVDVKKNAAKKETAQTKRRRNAKDKAGNSAKRRKRIVQFGEEMSSDDDMFARERSESPVSTDKKPQIFDDDDADEIPQTPVTSTHSNKVSKKRRVGKLIDKTYLDEENFCVTKKEYVMVTETDTDGENEEDDKKKDDVKIADGKSMKGSKEETKPKIEAKKKASPKKQATLMKFFKKS